MSPDLIRTVFKKRMSYCKFTKQHLSYDTYNCSLTRSHFHCLCLPYYIINLLQFSSHEILGLLQELAQGIFQNPQAGTLADIRASSFSLRDSGQGISLNPPEASLAPLNIFLPLNNFEKGIFLRIC